MCVTDHHDMTLAVKVVLNPKTSNQVLFLNYSGPYGQEHHDEESDQRSP